MSDKYIPINMMTTLKGTMQGKILKEMTRNNPQMAIWWNKMAEDIIKDMVEDEPIQEERKPTRPVDGPFEENVGEPAPPKKKKPRKKKAQAKKPESPRKRDKWEAVKV